MKSQHSVEIKELHRCSNDPVYFIKKYVKVRCKQLDGNPPLAIPFDMNHVRSKSLRHYHNNLDTVQVSSRHMGNTTLGAAYLLWVAMFQEYNTCVLIGFDNCAISSTIELILWMHTQLDSAMCCEIEEYNTGRILFKNGSAIHVIHPCAIQSCTIGDINILFCDDTGYYGKDNDTALRNMLSCSASYGTKRIMTSRLSTIQGYYSETLKDAYLGKSSFQYLITRIKHNHSLKSSMKTLYGKHNYAREFGLDNRTIRKYIGIPNKLVDSASTI